MPMIYRRCPRCRRAASGATCVCGENLVGIPHSYGCLPYLLAGFAMMGSCYACTCSVARFGAESRQQERARGPSSLDACSVAKEEVRSSLKAPKSADFPFGCQNITKQIGPRAFVVESYVDAQNSFGAMIRTNYRVRLHHDEKRNQWIIDELKTW